MQQGHKPLTDLETILVAESLALNEVLCWIKALGLKTSSPNSAMPLSHVALYTNLYSQFLSRSYDEKASTYQVEDGRINPSLPLPYFSFVKTSLLSSKGSCLFQVNLNINIG